VIAFPDLRGILSRDFVNVCFFFRKLGVFLKLRPRGRHERTLRRLKGSMGGRKDKVQGGQEDELGREYEVFLYSSILETSKSNFFASCQPV
jgi:hypothetical protein